MAAILGCGGGSSSEPFGSDGGLQPEGPYSIAGTVRSASYMVSDSDVNDPNATQIPNNTFDDAQAISAPVTVSGYVNVTGAGENGHSKDSGDPDDYFLVSLTQGMTVTLHMVANTDPAELNLYQYDEQQTLLDAALTASGDDIATLTITDEGTYYIRVEAVSDSTIQTAAGYFLTMGKTQAASPSSPLCLSADFVPGEVLIRFEHPAEDARSAMAGEAASPKMMGFTIQAGAAGLDRLLRRSETVDRFALLRSLGVETAFERSVTPGRVDSLTETKLETLWWIRALRKHTGIRFAEPNYIRRPLKVPNDLYYTYQWHYPLINLPDAWDLTTGSNDVVVAVVDTGVLLAHPDLDGRLLPGYDFISDSAKSLDGDGIDANPDDPGDQNSVEGSSFHGTHVAGTIAAATGNATGVAGIAWNAGIVPLRVLGLGGGTSYDIVQAVKYAAGLPTDYAGVQRDRAVDIINLSLGGETYSQTEADAFEKAREQGVIIMAPAGNNGTTTSMYPAAYDGVVSVSAVTIDENLAAYSNFGETVDVAAPGGSSSDSNGDGYMDGVLSTIGDDSSGTIEMGYAFSAGTSMAVSHVSGVAALMKALYPALTPNEFDALLQGGFLTQDLGDPGWDNHFGHGLIDAHKAVLVAQENGLNGGIPAILSASPSHLSFGPTLNQVLLTLENSGNPDEPLVISDFYSNATWLVVQATDDVDANGLGTYRVSVDRSGVSDGIYTGTATFESDANTVTVPVAMLVGTDAGTSEGGYHYILLIDANTNETLAQADSAGTDGVYPFRFSGLSHGDTVVIYAGTDPNNDGFICDDGEACGAYLSLDQPTVLTILGDQESLDFVTDVTINLSGLTNQSAAAPLRLGRLIVKVVAQ